MIGRWLVAPRVLLPRPNPGPVPWPSQGMGLIEVAWLLIASGWLILAAWLVWRGRRRAAPASPTRPIAWEADASPLVLWAARVRAALVARLGPSWAAKTTEELADSPALVAWLGSDRASQLIHFLRVADRAKFAGHLIDDPEWTIWAANWIEEEKTQPFTPEDSQPVP